MKRNFHFAETKAQKQASWMQAFNDQVCSIEPKHSGRIEWPSAQHFYNTGLDAVTAAIQYCENRK